MRAPIRRLDRSDVLTGCVPRLSVVGSGAHLHRLTRGRMLALRVRCSRELERCTGLLLLLDGGRPHRELARRRFAVRAGREAVLHLRLRRLPATRTVLVRGYADASAPPLRDPIAGTIRVAPTARR